MTERSQSPRLRLIEGGNAPWQVDLTDLLRAEEARASWSASPWGQAQTSRSQAEKVWKLAFKEYYNRTGGDFSVACQHADAAAEVYFKAAHASEELARKASSSAVRKDTEGRLKG